MKIVILAGGSGVRLWPLSQREFPKQFLHFGDGESLLQKTVRRMNRFPLAKEIILSTNAAYVSLVKAQIEKIGLSQRCSILLEPERKNTAAAIALAVRYLQEIHQSSPQEPLLVLPSDHFIAPEFKFFHYLEKAAVAAAKGKIVIFGIRPYKPETGYGYVRIGSPLADEIYEVEQFCEKPTLKKAKEYCLQDDYLWNAGMSSFTPESFWKEFKEHAKEIYETSELGLSRLLQEFSRLPNISIDYALMEKSKSLAICPMELHWSDVGSWDSVYEVLKKDQNGNVKIGNVIDIETKNSLIMGGKRLISTIGLKGVLVVETEEGIFIAKKGHSQKVRELTERLKGEL